MDFGEVSFTDLGSHGNSIWRIKKKKNRHYQKYIFCIGFFSTQKIHDVFDLKSVHVEKQFDKKPLKPLDNRIHAMEIPVLKQTNAVLTYKDNCTSNHRWPLLWFVEYSGIMEEGCRLCEGQNWNCLE